MTPKHIERTRDYYKESIRPITSFSYRRRIDILMKYVTGKDVLDLGCVDHQAVVEAKKEWWLHGVIKQNAKSVMGVDYNPVEVELLKQKGYDICVGDVENLDLGRTFDVVVAGELFEHLTNHRSFLESVRRHLKPGGIFVATMPNGNSLNYFMQTVVFGHEMDAWDHAAFFTPVTLSVMLKKCGFEAVEIILYQPDEVYHHVTLWHRIPAYLFNKIQQAACWLFPTVARGLIVVAKVKEAA